jgi:hypothetical protein
MIIGGFPHSVIPNFDHPGSTARQHRSYHDHEAPGQSTEVSDPVGMDGKTRQPNKNYNMSHWLVALQNSGYEACQARNMLWRVGSQFKTPLIIQKLIRPFFFASPWQFSLVLDNHPGSSLANPRPCPCSTNSQEKTCSSAETPSAKNCPSGQTPPANNKWHHVIAADIPCNVTSTSERHERPFTCVWLSYWIPPWWRWSNMVAR